MLQHDRTITISVGASRKATRWDPQTQTLSELYLRLQSPIRSPETQAEYLAMPKGRQDDLKDVGGFVAGSLSGPRRKAGAVTGRDIVTLDLDNIPANGTEKVFRALDELAYGYCVYSTRKHMPTAPRLRVLIPLDRTVTADEYEPCARRLAELIGMDLADPTTFEASRLMYWPSASADAEYVYRVTDLPLIHADDLLATYADWRDVSAWPVSPGAVAPARLAAKQGDPLTKQGVVGAFCRVYDIRAAIDKFLPGVYTDCDTGYDMTVTRMTFTGGSTTGGAVLYEDGKFLYSHHATDPCSGRLVNSFDLVRLHRFADLDDDAAAGTPINRLPSFAAMTAAAMEDTEVSGTLMRERWAQKDEAFKAVEPTREDDLAWMRQLAMTEKGNPRSTIDNVWIILENDPRLRGKFALNDFAGCGEVLGDLPWNPSKRRRRWEDADNSGLYWYLEKHYQIAANGKVDAALALHSAKHAFNEVTTYLSGLKWDGVRRLDTLFVDYLGADDTEYVRAVTRKAFTAAVARAMEPGTKFDVMTILSGAQGLGKSTLLDKMSCGWFSDGIRTFEGKEAAEMLQGVWLVEIAELQAFRHSDAARIKQFLSQRADRFRAAYGRHVKEIPRRCVMFGTTNVDDYLMDATGNRRFWPVDVGRHKPRKNVWNDLPKERDQLWAEAVVNWRMGETLYLTGDLDAAAIAQQENHRETSTWEGQILDFLDQPIPEDWSDWTLEQRRTFWAGGLQGEAPTLVPRTRVCALEIWCELLGGDRKNMKRYEAQEINEVIRKAGWLKADKTMRFGYCGPQKGWNARV